MVTFCFPASAYQEVKGQGCGALGWELFTSAGPKAICVPWPWDSSLKLWLLTAASHETSTCPSVSLKTDGVFTSMGL